MPFDPMPPPTSQCRRKQNAYTPSVNAMRKTIKIAGIVGLVALATSGAPALFVRPHIDNQPIDSSHSIQAQPGTSGALAAVLARSCADCHSNTVTTRWYTRIPPFSALMAHTANEGRKAVNFSEWTAYSPARQQALLLSSCNDANRGTMPVKAYLLFRSDARLAANDVETICSSSRQSASTPTTATPARRMP